MPSTARVGYYITVVVLAGANSAVDLIVTAVAKYSSDKAVLTWSFTSPFHSEAQSDYRRTNVNVAPSTAAYRCERVRAAALIEIVVDCSGTVQRLQEVKHNAHKLSDAVVAESLEEVEELLAPLAQFNCNLGLRAEVQGRPL